MSPFFIQAGTNTVSANDKIGIGLIGCNGMGFSDLQAFLRNPEVECVALADVDEGVLNKRAADALRYAAVGWRTETDLSAGPRRARTHYDIFGA